MIRGAAILLAGWALGTLMQVLERADDATDRQLLARAVLTMGHDAEELRAKCPSRLRLQRTPYVPGVKI